MNLVLTALKTFDAELTIVESIPADRANAPRIDGLLHHRFSLFRLNFDAVDLADEISAV